MNVAGFLQWGIVSERLRPPTQWRPFQNAATSNGGQVWWGHVATSVWIVLGNFPVAILWGIMLAAALCSWGVFCRFPGFRSRFPGWLTPAEPLPETLPEALMGGRGPIRWSVRRTSGFGNDIGTLGPCRGIDGSAGGAPMALEVKWGVPTIRGR